MISSGTMLPPVLRGASEAFTVLFCGHEFEVGWRATVESLASSGSTVQVSSDSHHSKVCVLEVPRTPRQAPRCVSGPMHYDLQYKNVQSVVYEDSLPSPVIGSWAGTFALSYLRDRQAVNSHKSCAGPEVPAPSTTLFHWPS